eukprot:CAMPEP_0116840730 /NCGR_PEP_ID=MMETSP0418-20121206/10527_1 /TAXON_ID=1158023 /ORGANISM="Astrosyne radiata, Strain 13vi08-1A" /LENGTH=353 /DNA_ID=CAMNT_0004471069 /DNA_START=21 /DNA_END=1083 /DNA_ORIENTATION=-
MSESKSTVPDTTPLLPIREEPPYYEQGDKRPRVAYAISITKCHWSVLEGAAVLGHSIDSECEDSLTFLGYRVFVLDVPLGNVSEAVLRKLEDGGCCGTKEYLKLYTYALELEDVAIHLDTDTLVLQELDDIFGLFTGSGDVQRHTVPTEANKTLPSRINFLFTRDYLAASRLTRDTSKWGIQGGMMVLRPNRTKLSEILGVIQKGNYSYAGGWAETKIGGFWGAAQIQGLLSYIYHNDPTAVELDRCIYNNMNGFMTFPLTKNDLEGVASRLLKTAPTIVVQNPLIRSNWLTSLFVTNHGDAVSTWENTLTFAENFTKDGLKYEQILKQMFGNGMLKQKGIHHWASVREGTTH